VDLRGEAGRFIFLFPSLFLLFLDVFDKSGEELGLAALCVEPAFFELGFQLRDFQGGEIDFSFGGGRGGGGGGVGKTTGPNGAGPGRRTVRKRGGGG